MFAQNIFRTLLSKLGSALISLFVLIISSRILGPENMGAISLIILGITIIQLVTGLLGGSNLVYMASRHHPLALLIPSYLLSVIGSLAVSLLLVAFDVLPHGSAFVSYGQLTFVLGVLISWTLANFNIILGKEMVKAHNLLSFFQSLVHLSVLLVLFYGVEQRTLNAYLEAYFMSLLLTFILSLFFIPYAVSSFKPSEVYPAVKQTFRYGFMVQLSSLLQLGNYRYVYLVMKNNLSSLGVFAVAMQVAESLWIIARSISMVQFARISNTDKPEVHILKTVFLVKLSFVATVLGLLFFFVLPTDFFGMLFGKDFSGLKPLLLILSPGILAVAMTSILSAHFSGSGKIYINTIGSFAGLVAAVLLATPLITELKLEGAALVNVCAYTVAFLWALIVFIIWHKVSFFRFFPAKEDGQLARSFFQRLFSKKQ